MAENEKMYPSQRYCKCWHAFSRHRCVPSVEQGKEGPPEICRDCDCLGFEQVKDVPISLWKHPLLKECSEVTYAIEVCGASPQITAAVVKSSGLLQNLANYLEATAKGKVGQ
jgi:hypothetical protein